MSKFHNYSFNNTLLIAMQKPDASLIAGFTAWKNQFQRNVKKGEKGIKIIAPSPFKIKQETEKIDPQTQKPVIGRDGKPVTEEKEITIPAYKVVSVFDVSQTEGKELPDIAALEVANITTKLENGKIHLRREVKRPWPFKPETINYSIGFAGWSRSVGAKTAREVLQKLNLYEEYPDYQDFLEGKEPMYQMVEQFEVPLRRLKDE